MISPTHTWGWFLGVVATVTGIILLVTETSIWGLPLMVGGVFLYVGNAVALVIIEGQAQSAEEDF
jgi:drug/metabolite transporter (DMT)-like permease